MMQTDEAIFFRLDPLADPKHRIGRQLSVLVRGAPVWPVEGDTDASIEIEADDLLTYLTEFWKPLLLRQTYPVLGAANSPSDFMRRMDSRWMELPNELAEEEAELVQAFEEAHNVALNFGGQFDLPPLWLMRDRDQMICEAASKAYRLPFHQVIFELNRVGDVLAADLASYDPGKWAGLIKGWNSRDNGDAINLLAWSAGLQSGIAERLVSDGRLIPPESVSDAANDNDPLRIAARLAGQLPAEQIESVIDLARSFAPHQAKDLDALSAECLAFLNALPLRAKPFQQGEEIARHVRIRKSISQSEKIDVLSLVKRLGIEVRVNGRAPENLEGLAIAGANYGPGAYVNSKANRPKHYPGTVHSINPAIRLTLAHELCHLLLDRGHAMSAVDVLQNRMSPHLEARAKAFAAELLLPSTIAARVWDEAGSPLDERPLTKVLQNLAAEFGVSISVAAWKVEHGAWNAPAKLRTMLGIIAPHR